MDLPIIHQISSIVQYAPSCSEWKAPGNRKMHYMAYQLHGEYVHYLKDRTLVSRKDHIIFLHAKDEYQVVAKEHGKSINIAFSLDTDLESTTVDCRNHPEMEGLFQKALKLYYFANESERYRCMSCIYRILAFVAGAQHGYIAPENSDVIETIRRYIDQNAVSRITNAELAQMGQFSERTMTELFKRKTGVTPNQYLLSRRVALAKDLLSSRMYGIQQIASICGFEDPCYFSRIFRQKTGVTPREYMNRDR